MDTPAYPTSAGGELGSKLGIRFYRYRAVLKRYWWILALTIGVGLLYEAYSVWTKPTRYVSLGKLSVSFTGNDENQNALANSSSWWGHTISELKGIQVRDRVRTEVSVHHPEWVDELDYTDIDAANEVTTYFFVITGKGRNPDFTQYYVDTVMKEFLTKRDEDWTVQLSKQMGSYIKRYDDEQKALETASRDLTNYLDEIKVPLPEDWEKQLADQTNKIDDNINRLESKLNLYKSMSNREILNSQSGNGGETTTTTGNSLLILNQLRAKKMAEFAKKKEIWTPAHPKYIAFVDELELLDAEIKELTHTAQEGRDATIKLVEFELDQARKKQIAITEESVKWGAVMLKYRKLKAYVASCAEKATATDQLIAKLKTEQGKSMENIFIHHQALPPLEEQRGVVRHLLMGTIGGLLLGLGILFLLDRADDRLASSSEMIEQFAEPILGQIPDVADTRTEAGLPLLQEEDDRYMFAEAFRSLRSSLIFMPNQTELKTLIVTSAIPNEGKSTVASNLALTMAAAGARVLLVDADLRRGDIAALFDIDGRQGLSNILRGEVTWQSSVQEVRAGKLSVIPRGPVTNQSGELLLRPIVQKLLDEWKTKFDLVIFNTAPILATDDTPTLAPNFDGTLMVIRASFTSARLTRNALNALYQRQVNVLGLIMNCVDTDLPDYYYYRYPKYYAA